jgi:hypothetical protein
LSPLFSDALSASIYMVDMQSSSASNHFLALQNQNGQSSAGAAWTVLYSRIRASALLGRRDPM